MRFLFFELIKTVMEINSLAGYFLELQISFWSFFEPSRPHNSQRIDANTEATNNTTKTTHTLTHTNTYLHITPISNTDTRPLHSKWHEACTVMPGQLFLAYCEHVRLTGNEPKYRHSDTQAS